METGKRALPIVFLLLAFAYAVVAFMPETPPFAMVFYSLSGIITGDIIAVILAYFAARFLFPLAKFAVPAIVRRLLIVLAALLLSVAVGYIFTGSLFPAMAGVDFALFVFFVLLMLAGQSREIFGLARNSPDLYRTNQKVEAYFAVRFLPILTTAWFALFWFIAAGLVSQSIFPSMQGWVRDFYFPYKTLQFSYADLFFRNMLVAGIGFYYFMARALPKSNYKAVAKILVAAPIAILAFVGILAGLKII